MEHVTFVHQGLQTVPNAMLQFVQPAKSVTLSKTVLVLFVIPSTQIVVNAILQIAHFARLGTSWI